MSVSYDIFTNTFLDKIREYTFLQLPTDDREEIIDGYMKRSVANFKKNCKYDLSSNVDDTNRQYTVDIADEDIDEIVDIISEGMVVQWLKPFVYQQDNLQNVLNTRDYSTYSPAELLMRIGNAYTQCKKEYTQMIREYSYNHGDLSKLHI